jgi:hypothetical protein
VAPAPAPVGIAIGVGIVSGSQGVSAKTETEESLGASVIDGALSNHGCLPPLVLVNGESGSARSAAAAAPSAVAATMASLGGDSCGDQPATTGEPGSTLSTAAPSVSSTRIRDPPSAIADFGERGSADALETRQNMFASEKTAPGIVGIQRRKRHTLEHTRSWQRRVFAAGDSRSIPQGPAGAHWQASSGDADWHHVPPFLLP